MEAECKPLLLLLADSAACHSVLVPYTSLFPFTLLTTCVLTLALKPPVTGREMSEESTEMSVVQMGKGDVMTSILKVLKPKDTEKSSRYNGQTLFKPCYTHYPVH